jgi:hypothetical protein
VAKLIVVCRRQFQMFALKTKSSITLHPFTFLLGNNFDLRDMHTKKERKQIKKTKDT